MQKYIKTSRKLKIQRKSLQFSIIFPPFYYGKSKVTKLSQRLNPLNKSNRVRTIDAFSGVHIQVFVLVFVLILVPVLLTVA